MSNVLHALDYLALSEKPMPGGLVVALGDEMFLRQLVLRSLRQRINGEDEEAPHAEFPGKTVAWRDVSDELATLSLFSTGPRVVIVTDADDFVSRHRSELEDRVTDSPDGGTLILAVKSLPSNTRLYKRLATEGGAIDCRPPQRGGRSRGVDTHRVCQWISQWAKQQYQFRIESSAAEALLDLTGPEFGLIDQNLAKLALYVEKGDAASADLVREVVAGWQLQTIWDIVDTAADGDAAAAMSHLHALLTAGSAPQAVFGQIAWSLRRYAKACRVIQQMERRGGRANLNEAIQVAALAKGPPQQAQARLRQIGRQRAGQLHQWLLEADLALKGSHSHPQRGRLVLERLLLRLARQTRPPA